MLFHLSLNFFLLFDSSLKIKMCFQKEKRKASPLAQMIFTFLVSLMFYFIYISNSICALAAFFCTP